MCRPRSPGLYLHPHTRQSDLHAVDSRAPGTHSGVDEAGPRGHRRNNEVDRWAKKAAGLSLPDVDPTDVSHGVIGGGGACAYPCTQMDPGLPEYRRVPRGTLDNLVTPEGHAPASAHLALGQRAMGSLRRAVGKASPTVPAMRAVPRHYRTSAPRFLPSLAALFHQPMDPLLGRVAPPGPRLATYRDHQRHQADILSPHPQHLS